MNKLAASVLVFAFVWNCLAVFIVQPMPFWPAVATLCVMNLLARVIVTFAVRPRD